MCINELNMKLKRLRKSYEIFVMLLTRPPIDFRWKMADCTELAERNERRRVAEENCALCVGTSGEVVNLKIKSKSNCVWTWISELSLPWSIAKYDNKIQSNIKLNIKN